MTKNVINFLGILTEILQYIALNNFTVFHVMLAPWLAYPDKALTILSLPPYPVLM